MEAMLKATEVAQLMGCSKEYVTRMAREGRLEHEKTLNERNRPMLLFPVSGLEPQLQQKYYAQLKTNLPEVRLPDGAGPKHKTPKAFDQYTADEREEIAWWLKTVDEWQTYRAKYPGKKAEADEKFIALCAKIDPEHEFSIDILYRKWKAVKDNDLDGLIDKRGKWRKGKSSIDETLWQAFLSFYLDENQHPIMRCYEYTKMWAREDFPDLVADMPSYTTFYRRIQSDIPEAVEVLGRQGEKAFRDRCAPYIKRTYDDMASNEWWIADNHTFDIITMGANGKRHRLYLTAFFDARSGIFTGGHVTTAPSSQSTLVALRKGILKYGIPENIYVDNGREFLTYDIGGLGHRKKKPKNGQEPFSPPPVFERLGIKMTNAIVRNAKAKIIERRFEDIKNQLSRLFETYTGGNVLEKPEKLKGVLKNGEIPMDSTLITVVEQLLEGYFNEAPYLDRKALDYNETRLPGEDDSSFRGRILQKIQNPLTSGNKNHYVYWAKKVLHVGDAKCVPCWNGGGTVKVIVLSDEKGVPSEETLQAVRDYIEENRPVGAKVTVVGATPIPVTIEVSIVMATGFGFSEAKESIGQYIREYLDNIAFQDNTPLSYYKIGERIFSAPGVQDIDTYTINGEKLSISAEVGEFFQLQEVIINETL